MNKKLYESIMKDLSKVVIKHLNEDYDDYDDDYDYEDEGDEPFAFLYNVIEDAVINNKIPIIGTAYGTPAINVYDALDFLEAERIGEDEDPDEIEEALYDMVEPFVAKDPDVLYQLEYGLDGLEAGSGELFDEPIFYKDFIKIYK